MLNFTHKHKEKLPQDVIDNIINAAADMKEI
jgi:hypothetical protein